MRSLTLSINFGLFSLSFYGDSVDSTGWRIGCLRNGVLWWRGFRVGTGGYRHRTLFRWER